jgi:hypothetical protein
VRNHRIALRVAEMTNLQTGHRNNNSDPRMKTLFASTSLAIVAATAVSAQQAVPVASLSADAEAAAALVGAPLYMTDGRIDPVLGIGDDWNAVGEVQELLLDPDGTVAAVIVEVGGILGIGGRTLSLSLDELTIFSEDADLDSVYAVLPGAVEDLDNPDLYDAYTPGRTAGAVAVSNEGSGMTTAAPPEIITAETGQLETSPFEMDQGVDAGTETDVASLDEGVVVANDKTPATAVITADTVVTTTEDVDVGLPEDVATNMPGQDDEVETEAVSGPSNRAVVADPIGQPGTGITREGYEAILLEDVVLARLEGQGLFNPAGERIGEVGGVIERGSETPLVHLDVGGFLGVAEHEIVVPATALTFLNGTSGIQVFIDATQEQLESLPEYEG